MNVSFAKLKKIIVGRYQQDMDNMFDIVAETLKDHGVEADEVAEEIKNDRFIYETLLRECTYYHRLKSHDTGENNLRVLFA